MISRLSPGLIALALCLGGERASAQEAHGPFSLEVSAAALIPVWGLADLTGPMLGPTLGLGYRTGRLELTARTGWFLYGRGRVVELTIYGDDDTLVSTYPSISRISVIPLLAGLRYSFGRNNTGLYTAAEAGLNILSWNVKAQATREFGDIDTTQRYVRPALNLGLGYVLSETLPIDIRAHVSWVGVLDNAALLGYGLSIGYIHRF
jgi:hypothetical protein